MTAQRARETDGTAMAKGIEYSLRSWAALVCCLDVSIPQRQA